ncbi:ribosomal protection-like ABC-F family protein [Candidatus Clostridium helianthi]|uniref:Ribosomal protection-like ABC-F family protein n=1 Tax=Candidatus Clostridium helianthi TaxID=3381660 RepID=A0ABW8SAB2_9CLOT
MSILTVKNMNHGFGDRAIFEDVSFRLLKGEHVGLIGANGEGKSTFMNIVTGKLMPDEGNVIWSNNVRVGYMDQHAALMKGQSIRDALRDAFKYLFDLEAEMNSLYEKMGDCTEDELNKMLERTAVIQDMLDHNGFYVIDPKVEEVAKGLGLLDLGLDKDVDDLSGGQRTKILLGKLLLQSPDILLLDEPTNYLDEEHIEWLKRYLQSYENAFILISHDVPFINSVVNLIYHVEERRLTRYVGNYDEFQRIYEENKKKLEAAYEKQQKEIARLEDFVARNKANVATANMAKSRQKKLDKMDIIELSKEKPKPEFNFKSARASGKAIFETKDLVIGYDSPLTKPLNLYMERGQKIALVGANGLGKSTLLKSLLGIIKPISGEVHLGDYQYIGYFEQEDRGNNSNTCIEEVWQEFPGYTQYQIRAALAKCGLTTKQLESQIRVLSGGEAAKVRLCKIINNETNILILDEPTNHLDVDAKDELKRALKEYKGTILLVSHEPEFYRDIITETWNCEDWTTKICGSTQK